MVSSLFGGSNQRPTTPGNNMEQLLERFNAFRRSIGNQDPQAMVQELLRSGRMTQEQYQQLAQMARQLSGWMR